jgi:hypothetical protein
LGRIARAALLPLCLDTTARRRRFCERRLNRIERFTSVQNLTRGMRQTRSPLELLSGSGIASMNFESICAVTWSANEGDDESSMIEAE